MNATPPFSSALDFQLARPAGRRSPDRVASLVVSEHSSSLWGTETPCGSEVQRDRGVTRTPRLYDRLPAELPPDACSQSATGYVDWMTPGLVSVIYHHIMVMKHLLNGIAPGTQ